MTTSDFDEDKSEGVDGLWSYSPERRSVGPDFRRADGTRIGTVEYPNEIAEYQIDTGIRSPDAVQGALVVAAQHREL